MADDKKKKDGGKDGGVVLFLLLGGVIAWMVATHNQKTILGQRDVDVGTGGVRMTDQAKGNDRRNSWVDMALEKSRDADRPSDAPGGVRY